jgi:hypothetical protein
LLKRALGFDRAEIDQRLSSIDSHTLRPRYQSDLVEDEDRLRFDRELAPQQRADSSLVYDRRTGEIQCFSAAAAFLLERCDGARTVEQIVEVVPQPAQELARRCIEQLSQSGYFEKESAS